MQPNSKLTSETASFLLSAASSLLLVLSVTTVLTPAYQTNDDFAMRTIASGMRTGQPSENLIYISILVGKVLKALYKAFPEIFWYDLMLYAFLALGGVTATYALARLPARGRWLAPSTLLLCLVLAALEPQFTIISGFCAGASVLLFISVWQHPLKRDRKSTRLNS